MWLRSKEAKEEKLLWHIPPKTTAWKINRKKSMQQEVKINIEEMIRKIYKVRTSTGRRGSEGHGAKNLQIKMVYPVEQWVNKLTRCKGEEQPQLDLVFTKIPYIRPRI